MENSVTDVLPSRQGCLAYRRGMADVTLHPVDSSMMSHIGYDPASKTLTILFQSGKRYEYDGVEQQVFDDFLTADSKGSYFRGMIDDCYPYRQVKGRRR